MRVKSRFYNSLAQGLHPAQMNNRSNHHGAGPKAAASA